MAQISARIPDELADKLDAVAVTLNDSRAWVVRQALEYYLADLEDLRLGLERLSDPADPVLDWEQVRCELLGQNRDERPTEGTR